MGIIGSAFLGLTRVYGAGEDRYEYIRDGLRMNLMAYDTDSYPGTGTTVTDLTGNGLNYSLVGSPTFNSEGYWELASSPQKYLQGTDDDLYTLGSAFTVEIYCRNNSFTNRSRLFVHWNTNGIQFLLNKGATAGYPFLYVNNNGVSATKAVSLNTWNHIVVSRDGDDADIYVNGELFESLTGFGTGAINDVTQTPRIGNNSITANEAFDGDIAHIRLYTTALSADEALNNYLAAPTFTT